MSVTDRRGLILAAATRLIAEFGFRGVSLETIAGECGLTKAGLQHHYPSKDALLVAVLRERDDSDRDFIAQYRSDDVSKSAVLARFREIIRRTASQREIVRLFTTLSAEALDETHPAHDYFRHRLAEGRESFLQGRADLYRHPETAAVDYIAFIDGLQLAWLRDASIDFEAHAMAFVESQMR